jgi:hypothetical protein
MTIEFIYVFIFMCLLKSPKANYEVSTSKEGNKKHIQRHSSQLVSFRELDDDDDDDDDHDSFKVI